MNVQRFQAATSREALAKARMAFGDATLILSNRQTPTGVEVVATTDDMLDTFAANSGSAKESSASKLSLRSSLEKPVLGKARANTPGNATLKKLAETPVEEDVSNLAMSTLSFQDYVRERMLRRRQEALGSRNDSTASSTLASTPASGLRAAAPTAERNPFTRSSAAAQNNAPQAASRNARAPIEKAAAPEVNTQGIAQELQSMRALIEERFTTMAWLGQAKQDPIQSNLMLKLIRAGYSPAVSRALLEKMPADASAGNAIRWVMDVLERNLKTDAGSKPIHTLGGTYALIGATGVGKTTTAAKLAALCAKTHGAQSVGLITLDTFRVAAHEQLRAYGRMLGVVAHLAHDRAALQDLLNLLGNKKMVLIDTAGMAPKDPRTAEMLELLDLPKVNNLLVMNAGAHGDTHDHVINAFKPQGDGGVILSKIDEAAKLGPALDALIRHQLVMRGVTHGQRVPEDWEQADAASLVRASMRTEGKSAYDPTAADLGFFFSEPGASINLGGHAHA